MKRSYRASESLIHSLPTFPATLATPQSAAATAGCDRACRIKGCDRVRQDNLTQQATKSKLKIKQLY
ncbi:hypothetical protein H6F96_20880 [Microcoleus sp. FACHB-53]|nr:hypothetical protein [Microcoleus sp. FACHB-53]